MEGERPWKIRYVVNESSACADEICRCREISGTAGMYILMANGLMKPEADATVTMNTLRGRGKAEYGSSATTVSASLPSSCTAGVSASCDVFDSMSRDDACSDEDMKKKIGEKICTPYPT